MSSELLLKRIIPVLILVVTVTNSKADDAIDILFLGNSYTARHDIPGLVERILEEGDPGIDVKVSRVNYGGQNMFKHSTYYFSGSFIEQATITDDEIKSRISRMQQFLTSEQAPDPLVWKAHQEAVGSNRKFVDIHRHIQSAIRNHETLLSDNPRKKWDYVVLQSWRDVSADVEQGYGKYAVELASVAKANGAEVILYMTSPETQNEEPVSEPLRVASADRDLNVGLDLAGRIQPKVIVHVPLAIKLIQTGGTDLCFRYVNDGHPNQTCAFLTANLFYAAFTGKSPEPLSFDTIVETKAKNGRDPDGGELKRVFSGETKSYIQKAAWQTVQKFEHMRSQ